MYREWGFFDTPFSYKPLEKNLVGDKLLVGRKKEKAELAFKLKYTDKICTVEGENGIGKTSTINVVSYNSYEDIKDDRNHVLIPCIDTFQLGESTDLVWFRRHVLLTLAQTIIKTDIEMKDSETLRMFFNPTRVTSIDGGLSILGCGASGGKATEVNVTAPFEEEGFLTMIIETMEEAFSEYRYSGIVCIIDNLELVANDQTAKFFLEQLRDTVFNIPGTKWVLCGTNHIFRSVINSPRLAGYMNSPIKLGPISKEDVPEIFQKRLDQYASESYYLPFNLKEFVSLYRILAGNTRGVFNFLDEYCIWILMNEELPDTDIQKEEMFNNWMEEKALDTLRDMQAIVKPNTLETFFKIITAETDSDQITLQGESLEPDFIEEVEKTHLLKCDYGNIYNIGINGAFLRYYFGMYDTYDEIEDLI